MRRWEGAREVQRAIRDILKMGRSPTSDNGLGPAVENHGLAWTENSTRQQGQEPHPLDDQARCPY